MRILSDMTTSPAAKPSKAIKFFCILDQDQVEACVAEAVRELCRSNVELRRGPIADWNTVCSKVQAYVRHGIEFLRTGDSSVGMACYHYEAELLRLGYAELVWGGGCLATMLAAGYAGKRGEAQAGVSGPALYVYGLKVTAEARKAYCAVRTYVCQQARLRYQG